MTHPPKRILFLPETQQSPLSPVSALLNLEASQKVEYYVRERQKEEGGFGLTPLLPASVADTFFAIRILELLGRDQGLENTKQYVALTGWSISTRVKTLYQLAYLQRKFGILKKNPPPPPPSDPLSLESTFYWQKMKHLWGNSCPRPGNASGWALPSPKLPASYTVLDLCYYLNLHHNMPSQEVASWVEWVQACQSPDGGFGFMPGTSSFMDNVLPAMEILSRFNRSPLDSSKLLNFILGCQTRSGGFARKNGGVAFLESSYQAVKSLHLLIRIILPATNFRTKFLPD